MIDLTNLCEHQVILFGIALMFVYFVLLDISNACVQFALTQWQIRKILKEGCKVIDSSKLD